MNTSTDTLQPGQQAASSASKPLWAAVGILGVAVLAMGGTMIYQQRNLAAPLAQAALAVPPAVVAPPAQAPAPAAAASAAAVELVEKPEAAPVKPAPAPVKKSVKPTPKPSSVPSYAGGSAAPSPYPSTHPSTYPSTYPSSQPSAIAHVCAVCGSVESVTPVTRSTKPAGVGVGTIAGGVLGAVLGNQVGRGNGRTLGTIVGAVGGGFAGNAIENNMRKETVYQVGVRMEDGSRRMLEVAQPPAVGSRVTVDGSSIRGSDGASYNAPAPIAPHAAQPAPVYQGG